MAISADRGEERHDQDRENPWAALVLGVLIACGRLVSFRNASFSEGDTTRTIPGLIAKPEGKGPFPAVVLLHTCGGLRPHVYTDWTNYLTALGYVTFSVDSLDRAASGVVRLRSQEIVGNLAGTHTGRWSI